jgi:hypothetical protein
MLDQSLAVDVEREERKKLYIKVAVVAIGVGVVYLILQHLAEEDDSEEIHEDSF